MPSNVSKGNQRTSDQAEVVVGEGEPSAEDPDSVRDQPAPDADEALDAAGIRDAAASS